MSIGVSALTTADESAWQVYINSHPEGTIYHTLEWRDILYNEYRYEPAYLIAKETLPPLPGFMPVGAERLDESERIVGVLPMFIVKNLRGRRLRSLPFSIYGGPICDRKDVVSRLIQRAIGDADGKRLKSLVVRGNNGLEGLVPSKKYISSVLGLDAGLDSIWDRLKYNTRTAIRRAQTHGLTFEFERDDKIIEDFYSLQLSSRRRQGLPTPSIGYYQSIIDGLKEKAKLALVRKEGKAIAGGLFFMYHDVVLFALGASDYRYQTYRPNDLLVWETLQWASGEGCKRFDFGLTPDTDNELLRFKRKWGGVSTSWHDYIYPEDKEAERPGISHNVGSAILKRLPLRVSTRVGKYVIRCLG